MKRRPIRKISLKQQAELELRKRIKAELMFEQLMTAGYIFCMTCQKRPDWRGISLSHIIPLSRGGPTTRENCLLECQSCHTRFEKKPELRAEELKKYWE